MEDVRHLDFKNKYQQLKPVYLYHNIVPCVYLYHNIVPMCAGPLECACMVKPSSHKDVLGILCVYVLIQRM